ncbi:MAG TPA: response regulator [Nitrospirota bacterium]|nr:response regulator [Nitrospirota bacterium]
MPVKILLADKSITIQKVVEMLFSGKDYEVACVSEGDTALHEASRILPDVVLVDVDLPRIDGYSFAERLKQTPQLSGTPVILMMSRDDVYDSVRGKQARILDYIAKPFESQELIGKVKKALVEATTHRAEPKPVISMHTTASAPGSAPSVPPPIAKLRQTTPSDIFDIIKEAPTEAELKQSATLPSEEESIFEVEPEVEEVEETAPPERSPELPVGDKAIEEMRVGLGLNELMTEPEIVPFEAFDSAMESAPKATIPSEPTRPASPGSALQTPKAPGPPPMADEMVQSIIEATVSRAVKEAIEKVPAPAPKVLPESELRGIAEKIMAKMAQDVFRDMPPPLPKISDETVQRGIEEVISQIVRDMARDVIEKVVWEVIPPLAEQMIKEEIERLKGMQ